MGLNTPVAFFIFNRPDLTALVFAEIARAKPEHLLIVADGPRSVEEENLCQATRNVVAKIDWECKVKRNYSDVNMGCKQRISSGLNWVFSEVAEAIILEDDCLPHPSFFHFCEEMLVRYRSDNRVMHVAGANLIPKTTSRYSYRFSRLTPIWGWATWRRAWKHYDIEMTHWPEYNNTRDVLYFGNQQANVRHFLDEVYHDLDTWDGQWWFSCLNTKGLSVIPKVNLIHNMGHRWDATHTKASSHVDKVPIQEITAPFAGPVHIHPDRDFDYKYLEFCYGKVSSRVMRFVDRVVRKLVKTRR